MCLPLAAQGCFSAALAEYALAACLHFAKDVSRMQAAQHAKHWEPFTVGMLRYPPMPRTHASTHTRTRACARTLH